jgi:multiple sugar transport system substrate-binding protein
MFIIYIFSTYSFFDNVKEKPIKIFFADNISPAHRKLINLFNEKYKGKIEVIPLDLPFNKFSTNDRKELLARYFRTKSDRIDVFSVDQIWVPRFARWAIPLDSFFSQKENASILKYAIKTCYVNDSLVAGPLYIDVAIMYFRKDLIEKLKNGKQIENKIRKGITWEEMLSLQNKFQHNPLFVFQADDFEGVVCIFSELLSNLNEKLMDNDSLRIRSTKAEKALQFLDDIVRKYKISPYSVTRFREDDSYKYFMQNKGVFLRGWTGLFKNNIIGKQFLYLKDSIEEAPVPHIEGSKTSSVYGGWDLMISKFSTKIPQAICFVKFLLSKEAQKILFEEGGYIPISDSIYNDYTYVNNHSELKFYSILLKDGLYRPFTKQYTNISDVLSYYINQSIKGNLSAHEALYKAYGKLNSKSILLK